MEDQQIKRVRRTSAEIIHLLEEFSRSGLSAKEFCLQHTITEASFYKWRSRHGYSTSAGGSGFLTLKREPPQPAADTNLFAEVRGIRIYQPVTSSYLKELLS